jgi:hypothetical protein
MNEEQQKVSPLPETNPDKKYAALLPANLRDDIGAAFSRVLSDDPSIKVPATRSFMALLQTAFILNGDTRYDTLITQHTLNAIDAVSFYALENWAAAVEICYKIQADLGFLVYCGYGTSDGKSFSLPASSGAKK